MNHVAGVLRVPMPKVLVPLEFQRFADEALTVPLGVLITTRAELRAVFGQTAAIARRVRLFSAPENVQERGVEVPLDGALI
jgi:hypothetical protein